MEITSTSETPFERLAIDIVGPLPLKESGNIFILTAQDDLIKFSTKERRTKSTSRFRNYRKHSYQIYYLFWHPKNYPVRSRTKLYLIKDLTNLFKTKHISTTPYHPQTNGAFERSHLTLKNYLKHYIELDQTD